MAMFWFSNGVEGEEAQRHTEKWKLRGEEVPEATRPRSTWPWNVGGSSWNEIGFKSAYHV